MNKNVGKLMLSSAEQAHPRTCLLIDRKLYESYCLIVKLLLGVPQLNLPIRFQ